MTRLAPSLYASDVCFVGSVRVNCGIVVLPSLAADCHLPFAFVKTDVEALEEH